MAPEKGSTQPTPEEVREMLSRILASPRFVSSGRLSTLLRYTVEESLGGRRDQLKETVIGMEVFQRDSTYDPRIDPVVRVMAGRLRQRLEEYYRTEGSNDAVLVDYPKGTYAPHFRRRSAIASVGPVSVEVIDTASIAVLPLASLSPDGEQEFFADGMTDAIITDLAKISGLRVISRTSVMQFKRSTKPIPEIAQMLGVGYLLEGSVLWAGPRMRITTQLIAHPPERHVWAESYEGDLSDVLRLQSEIARQVAREIHVRLTPGDDKRLSPQSAVKPDAYLNYLQGQHRWLRNSDRPSLEDALIYLNKAVELEPGFAAGHAAKAEVLRLLGAYYYVPGARQGAREAAQTAIRLDPESADGRAALAAVCLDDFEWQPARRELETVLAANPSHAKAHLLYGELLLRQGECDAALAEMRRARDLDPLSLYTNDSFGVGLIRARRFDEALDIFQRLLEINPAFPATRLHLGILYRCMGRFQDAIQELERLRAPLYGVDVLALIAATQALAGQKAPAIACVEDLKHRLAEGAPVAPHSFGQIYTALGEVELALDWLERAFEQRSFLMGYLAVEPSFDRLRGHPRFEALVQRLKLRG
jgi:TolB-like protein/Tfp pilus assembly protein PilF